MAKSSANKAAAKKRTAPGASFKMTSANNGGATYRVPPPIRYSGGASLTGSPGPGKPSPKPAPAPAPKPAPAPPVQPFLTPAQQAALTSWNTKYANDLATYTQNDTNAWANYNTTNATDILKNAQNQDLTNQSMGARGMFQSSIRDNALNDLAVTLAQQQNILQTTRDATLFRDQTARSTLGGENAAQQSSYNGLAVTNAQGIVPVPPPASPNQVVQTPASPRPAAPKPAAPPKPKVVTPKPKTVAAAKTRAGGQLGATMTFGTPKVGSSGGVGIP
jgi:hypothetical protein